jgi:hypothetical protein
VEEVDAGRSPCPYSNLRSGIAHRSTTEPPRRRRALYADPRPIQTLGEDLHVIPFLLALELVGRSPWGL